MDHFRKINKTSFIQTSDDFNFLSNLPQRDRNIEDKFMQQETEKHLRAMLDTLREEQREVIILKHFANLSFKEIAELTNCSINTALGRMRYGLLQLRKIASTQPGLCH